MWLPAVERRGEIHFWFAKSLPYSARLGLAFALMAAGLMTQIALLSTPRWPVGLPLVVVGIAMLLVKGYENTVRMSSQAEAWRSARRAEVERILEINKKQRKWDQDAVDATNPLGCLAFVALAALLVSVAAGLPMLLHLYRHGQISINFGVDGLSGYMERFIIGGPAEYRSMVLMVLANGGLMLVPFWYTGTRSILKNDKLVIKAGLFLDLERAFESVRREGEEFQYQIQTATARDESGEVPVEVKAIIAFRNGPPEFLGLQMQVSMNSVQGKDYPYFYCVLVAKEAFGEVQVGKAPRNIVVESSDQDGVNVVVIRQHTTRRSGYHTNTDAVRRLFGFALQEARGVVERAVERGAGQRQ